jgi:hypothetical protein
LTSALRIGDKLRVPANRRRVVVLAFLGTTLDRPGAESLRTTLNMVDERVLTLAGALAAERQGIVAVVGPARDADLVGRLQAAEDAGHTASGQLEQAVTQLDDILSLLPKTGFNLPFDSISTVPDLATSALNYLKQALPPVGQLLQAILAGGG